MVDITPKLMLTKVSMKPPAKAMCVECPLSKTSKRGHLGGYNSVLYVEILHGPASIACHLSKGFPDGLEGIPEQRHCTGVAAYRANYNAKHPHSPCDPMGSAHDAMNQIGPRDDVFANPTEFHEHHNPPR